MSFVQQAIQDYRELIEDEEFLRLIKLREGAEREEKIALANAEKKERIRIAKNLLALGVPMDRVISACGLRKSEIDALKE